MLNIVDSIQTHVINKAFIIMHKYKRTHYITVLSLMYTCFCYVILWNKLHTNVQQRHWLLVLKSTITIIRFEYAYLQQSERAWDHYGTYFWHLADNANITSVQSKMITSRADTYILQWILTVHADAQKQGDHYQSLKFQQSIYSWFYWIRVCHSKSFSYKQENLYQKYR